MLPAFCLVCKDIWKFLEKVTTEIHGSHVPSKFLTRQVFVFVESDDAENDVPGEPLHLYLRPG